MGASRKAVIFTESRRTQDYLKDFLETNGYAGKIVLFNGSNTDAQSKDIYERWSDGRVIAAEKELADTKAQIKALNRQARLATTTDEQHTLQLKIRELEQLQRRQRERIFDVEDEITEKRDRLITTLEKRMVQRTDRDPLFTIQWQVL